MKKFKIIPRNVWEPLFSPECVEASSSAKSNNVYCQVADTLALIAHIANGAFKPAENTELSEFFAVAWGIHGEDYYTFDAADIAQAEELAKEHFAGGDWFGIHFYGSSEKIIKSITL